MKSFFEDAGTGILEGMRDGYHFFLALIAAPFLVFITGRWKRRKDDSRSD